MHRHVVPIVIVTLNVNLFKNALDKPINSFILNRMTRFITQLTSFFTFFVTSSQIFAVYAQTPQSQFKIDTGGLPILGIGDLLTFIIRLIFIIAGLAALIYGLWGGLAWITSGGDKDAIGGARNKIQAAVVGIFVLIVVLTIIWTLETVIFRRSICFGISCNVTIPGLKITPLPAETCSDLCLRTFIDEPWRDGVCKVGGCAAGEGDKGNPTKPGGANICAAGSTCCCTP